MTGWSGTISTAVTFDDGDTIDGDIIVTSTGVITIINVSNPINTAIIRWNESGFGKAGFKITVRSGGRVIGSSPVQFVSNLSTSALDVAHGFVWENGSLATFNKNVDIRNCLVAMTDPDLPNIVFNGSLLFVFCTVGVLFADAVRRGDLSGFTSVSPATSLTFILVNKPITAHKGFKIKRMFIATFPANFSSPLGYAIRAGTADLASPLDSTWPIQLIECLFSGSVIIIGAEQDVTFEDTSILSTVTQTARVVGEDDALVHINFAGGSGVFQWLDNLGGGQLSACSSNQADTLTALPDNPSADETGGSAIKISGWSDDPPNVVIDFGEVTGTKPNAPANLQGSHEVLRIDLEQRVAAVAVKGGTVKLDGLNITRQNPTTPVDPHDSHVSLYGTSWDYRGIIAHNLLDVQIGHRVRCIFGRTAPPNFINPTGFLGSNLRRWLDITPRKDTAGDFFDTIRIVADFYGVVNEVGNVGVSILPDDIGSIGDPALGDFGYIDIEFDGSIFWQDIEPTFSTDHGPGKPAYTEVPQLIDVALMNPVFSSKDPRLVFNGCIVKMRNRDTVAVSALAPRMIRARDWDGEIAANVEFIGSVEWLASGTTFEGEGWAFYQSALRIRDLTTDGRFTKGIAFKDPVRVDIAGSRFLALFRAIEFAAAAFSFQPSDGVLDCNTFIACDVALRNLSQRQWVDMGVNNFDSSVTFAVEQTAGPFVWIVETQFWGRGDGPSGAGSGNGDPVSTFVDFTPFEALPCGATVFRVGLIDIYPFLQWPVRVVYTPNAFQRTEFELFDEDGIFTLADFEGQEIEAIVGGVIIVRGFADQVEKIVLDGGAFRWIFKGLDFFGRARQLVVPASASFDYATTPKTINVVFADMVTLVETQYGLGLFQNTTTNPTSTVNFTLDARRLPINKVLRELVKAASDEGRAWWMNPNLACFYRAPLAGAKTLTDPVDDASRLRDIEDTYNRVIVVFTGGEHIENDAASQAAIGLREWVNFDARITLVPTATAKAKALLDQKKPHERIRIMYPIDIFTWDLRDIVALTFDSLELSSDDHTLEEIEHEFRIVTFQGSSLVALKGDTFLTFGKTPIQIRRLLLGEDDE